MSELLKPPTVPSAILSYFFSNQSDFAAVIGDMGEEFHQRVQNKSSSVRAAKFWYWREAFRNALALTAREVFRTPIRTLIVAFGCLAAVNAVTLSYCIAYFYYNPDGDLMISRRSTRIRGRSFFCSNSRRPWPWDGLVEDCYPTASGRSR